MHYKLSIFSVMLPRATLVKRVPDKLNVSKSAS